MTKVINLFGGPGVGKSTIALGLTYHLKLLNKEVEYVSEVAKDLVWEERHRTLTYQSYLFGKQNRNIQRVIGKVEFIVTDSPPLMCLVYSKSESQSFHDYVVETHNWMNNLNIYLHRVLPYSTVGRYQDETEARKKDSEIHNLLQKNHIPYVAIDGFADLAVPQILDMLNVR